MTAPSDPSASETPADGGANVGLFVTCLVDVFRPQVGHAAVSLLEAAGCRVSVPVVQTCCGQPAFNSGDKENARDLALAVIETFEDFDYTVAPSGSCAAMLKIHYPALFEDDPAMALRAKALAARSYELTSFLVDVLKQDSVTAAFPGFPGKAAYHDSCSGLRELGVRAQPRHLLDGVDGLSVTDLPDSDVCCGFGGTFCVKYPDIANHIVEDKTRAIAESGAGMLLAGDVGCLMHIAGKLKREGSTVKVRHVAEVLAGMTDEPAIGDPDDGGPENGEGA